MQKGIIISLVIALVIILGSLYFAFSGVSAKPEQIQNVRVENGEQVVEIFAKGGYAPRNTVAEAGVPTVLKIRTNGTYDCSAALVIPKLGFRKILVPAGTEEIRIPAEEANGTLQGVCSMGMYSFSVEFR